MKPKSFHYLSRRPCLRSQTMAASAVNKESKTGPEFDDITFVENLCPIPALATTKAPKAVRCRKAVHQLNSLEARPSRAARSNRDFRKRLLRWSPKRLNDSRPARSEERRV